MSCEGFQSGYITIMYDWQEYRILRIRNLSKDFQYTLQVVEKYSNHEKSRLEKISKMY